MTLQQEAYEKIFNLSDDSIRLIIALIDKLSLSETTKSRDISNARLAAFDDMEKRRKESPFPQGVDYEKIREEAMAEKYEGLA